jgi:signal peptidase II
MKQRWLILVMVGSGLDRLIKSYVINQGGYWLNQGVVWGWWPGNHWIVINLLILLGVGWWGKFAWPSALVMAGGLGNWLDRLIYGGVVDYLDVGWWPSFNLSDVLIMVGIFFWIKQEWQWSLR